ncbi:MAG: hypothetical protein J7L88_06225, partial [Thermoplasmata archaeon]|nr:hypothetical protein [Thermoplasmata archaeon]
MEKEHRGRGGWEKTSPGPLYLALHEWDTGPVRQREKDPVVNKICYTDCKKSVESKAPEEREDCFGYYKTRSLLSTIVSLPNEIPATRSYKDVYRT